MKLRRLVANAGLTTLDVNKPWLLGRHPPSFRTEVPVFEGPFLGKETSTGYGCHALGDRTPSLHDWLIRVRAVFGFVMDALLTTNILAGTQDYS